MSKSTQHSRTAPHLKSQPTNLRHRNYSFKILFASVKA